MTNYCGYMGKVLLLDLDTHTTQNYIWTDLAREKYIGGKAMASKILYDNLTGKEKPFDPENLIVIATGPLTGTGAPSSNRFDISSLSPLTGITSSSNCGGNFGHYLKKAGLDALIIRGKCETLSWIEIENGEFIFHDAQDLRDLKCGETQAALQEKLNAEHDGRVSCGMVCIGPAGENLVRYASVISGERAAGRAGMGAVFGSKNLKAITAAGDAVPGIYDKEAAAAHRKKWVHEIRSHPLTGEQLPKMGTAGLVSSMQAHGLLSTRNYAKGQFEQFEAVSGEALAEELTVANSGCLSCPIRCTRRVPVDGKNVKGPELETLGLLSGNIENANLEQVCRWNYELDELGMDTISTAGTIAWAMEANEKGLWQNGLRFGETEGLSQVFDDIAHRRGIGAELAEGSKRLSEKYGGKEFAIQSKGMELAAYEPRRAVGLGLGYAVANRGGCHLNGGYLVVLEGLGMNVDGQTPRGKADLCMVMQDLMESISCGGQCLFTSYAVLPAFMVRNPNGILQRAVNAVVPFAGPAVRIYNKIPEIACYHCPIACGRIIKHDDKVIGGPEYEPLWAYGSDCGNDDLYTIDEANRLCNEYGLDAIGVPCTIAAAMELYKRGYIKEEECAGVPLEWGSKEALIEWTKRMGDPKTELDWLMSSGSVRLCEHYGHPEYSMSVKKQEIPAYDARAIQGIGINYATANCGAAHVRGYMIAPEVVGIPVQLDRTVTDEKASWAKTFQDLTAVIDSMGNCLFTSFALGAPEYTDLLNAATGTTWTPEQVLEIGDRIFNIERMFNKAAGMKPEDDRLPKRLLEEPISNGPSKGMVSKLSVTLPQYYEARGWVNAFPTDETLKKLGLDECVGK